LSCDFEFEIPAKTRIRVLAANSNLKQISKNRALMAYNRINQSTHKDCGIWMKLGIEIAYGKG
jgi:hypothetical protein